MRQHRDNRRKAPLQARQTLTGGKPLPPRPKAALPRAGKAAGNAGRPHLGAASATATSRTGFSVTGSPAQQKAGAAKPHTSPGNTPAAGAARTSATPRKQEKTASLSLPLLLGGMAVIGAGIGLLLVAALRTTSPETASLPVARKAALASLSAPMAFGVPGGSKGEPAESRSRQQVATDARMPLLVRFETPSATDLLWARAPRVQNASLTITDEPQGGTLEIMKSPPPEPVDKTFTLRQGETLVQRLVDMGVSRRLAKALAQRINDVYPLRKLRPGVRFTVTLEQHPDYFGIDVTYPVHVVFSPQPGKRVVVDIDDEGQFIARLETGKERDQALAAAIPYRHVRGTITSSLYASAKAQGVPDYIISQMLRALSHQVDLQRQVRRGDTFEILYGRPFSGTSKRYVLHYAALNLHGRRVAFYRFTPPDGKTGYYDAQGRSTRRGLMRTPISGARISSRFGLRRHPILGYTKMHTGVDFAAGTGTPIHAAGSGVVIHAGWKGGYGRAVMIRHPNGYVTLYAHQSRIAPGISKGVHVTQGQVIGYVGASGRATGPHLHFEVRIQGKPVNPLKVRTASRQQLKGKALAAFRKRKKRIEALLEQVPVDAQIARR